MEAAVGPLLELTTPAQPVTVASTTAHKNITWLAQVDRRTLEPPRSRSRFGAEGAYPIEKYECVPDNELRRGLARLQVSRRERDLHLARGTVVDH